MNREGVSARRSPLHLPELVYAVLFCGLIAAGLYCGYLAYTTIRQFAAHTQFKAIPPIILAPTAQPDKAPVRPQQPASDPQKAQTELIVPDTEAKERINILVLGIDQRPGESATCRTDTMMLASINPKDMSVSILSIPRDLWLEIPHYNHEKDRINTAHYWGEKENYPGGGSALAMKTVQYNFGVPVHYYVRLNFVGFERMIDYIGGIDVDVPVTIDDEKYPAEDNGYQHVYIPAGRNHFDGEMALKYARTRRGTGDGDFSRMERQQQVILAIRDRVLSLKNLPQLILQSPKLLREMGDSVETNIPVEEMLALAELGQQVARENIQTATINRDMTDDWWTPSGELVLLYDRAKARPVIDDLFSDPTPEAEVTQTSPVEQLGAERARIVVYNGTTVDGLAASIQSFLAIQGMDVIRIGNADRADYGRTIIRVYGDKPFTTEWLSSWLSDMGISDPLIERPVATSDIDIVIVIGTDFRADKIN
jgi:LCP family protein required for cell wall assembly